MDFRMQHMNINVMDMEKSLKFYKEALGLTEARRKQADDGSFELVYLKDANDYFQLELTWLRDREEPYDLEDNEIHLALTTDDFDGAFKKHEEMGIISLNNQKMGVYFTEDPDGYWVEITNRNKKR